jgi:hypothetical protein
LTQSLAGFPAALRMKSASRLRIVVSADLRSFEPANNSITIGRVAHHRDCEQSCLAASLVSLSTRANSPT